MAFQLASRTSQIDGMLIAVGKRIVKMNSALATFEDIKLSIENLVKSKMSLKWHNRLYSRQSKNLKRLR